jgi:Polyketide cyclase / dehydrase and lipid transport
MLATKFDLVTDWSFGAPRSAVWQALMHPEEWPSWWRAVVSVEQLAPGDANGVDAVRRMTWRTALPYTLTFNMRVIRVEPMSLIEGIAEGELEGLGRWTLSGDAITHVHYEWIVEVTKPWQRLLAPALRPLFTWNHDVVMRWGREGLARKLATR